MIQSERWYQTAGSREFDQLLAEYRNAPSSQLAHRLMVEFERAGRRATEEQFQVVREVAEHFRSSVEGWMLFYVVADALGARRVEFWPSLRYHVKADFLLKAVLDRPEYLEHMIDDRVFWDVMEQEVEGGDLYEFLEEKANVTEDSRYATLAWRAWDMVSHLYLDGLPNLEPAVMVKVVPMPKVPILEYFVEDGESRSSQVSLDQFLEDYKLGYRRSNLSPDPEVRVSVDSRVWDQWLRRYELP